MVVLSKNITIFYYFTVDQRRLSTRLQDPKKFVGKAQGTGYSFKLIKMSDILFLCVINL